jgi:hypothetical protein
MQVLFDYRKEEKVITTQKGDKIVKVIRRGPRGIVARVIGYGIIVIYDKTEADDHMNDTEEQLLTALISKIDAI